MPALPQRWLGFRQAEGVPRRPISLHGYDTLRRARPSPSKEPWRVWSFGRGGEWALVVLDRMPRPGAGGEGDMTVEYLTSGQVAERLQVPVSMVVQLLDSGKLSGTKVNRLWQVPVAALKE